MLEIISRDTQYILFKDIQVLLGYRYECSTFLQLFEIAIPFSVGRFVWLKNSQPNAMHPLNTKSYAAVITTFTHNYAIALGYILIQVLDMKLFMPVLLRFGGVHILTR